MKMKTILGLVGIVMVALVGGAGGAWYAWGPTKQEMGRVGTVRVLSPKVPQGVVMILSDWEGWSWQDTALMLAYAFEGRMVMGIDTAQFKKGLDGTAADECSFPEGDLEKISQRLQKTALFPSYQAPVLVGKGYGALVAHVVLDGALPGTFAGGVGLNEVQTYHALRPFCSSLMPVLEDKNALIWRYQPSKSVASTWVSLSGQEAFVPVLKATAPFLVKTVLPADVQDLPLIEMPNAASGDLLAIVVSGDGGWRDIDKSLAETLSSRGVPVIGWDALRYFWQAKTPEKLSQDLARVIGHYTKAWGRSQVVLIGYSFGADVLPATFNRLPEDVQKQVKLVSLLGFSERADFEIRVAGWLGQDSADGPQTLPEIAQMKGKVAVQCVYGEEEDDTACLSPDMPQDFLLKMSGGHHFDGRYADIAEAILKTARAP